MTTSPLRYPLRTPFRYPLRSPVRGEVIMRSFLNCDPVLNTHLTVTNPITHESGIIVFEIDFSLTDNSDYFTFFGDENSNNGRVLTVQTANSIRITDSAGLNKDYVFPSSFYDGELHTLKVTRDRATDDCHVYIDNVESTTGVFTQTLFGNGAVNYIVGARGITPAKFFTGTLANFKITNDVVTTTFPIDQPSGNSENSLEGNNSLTYVNAPTSQREALMYSLGVWQSFNKWASGLTGTISPAGTVSDTATPFDGQVYSYGDAPIPEVLANDGTAYNVTENTNYTATNDNVLKVKNTHGSTTADSFMPVIKRYLLDANWIDPNNTYADDIILEAEVSPLALLDEGRRK